MRISDWSSDVCSSDLRETVRSGKFRRKPAAGRYHGLEHRIALHQSVAQPMRDQPTFVEQYMHVQRAARIEMPDFIRCNAMPRRIRVSIQQIVNSGRRAARAPPLRAHDRLPARPEERRVGTEGV